MSKRCPSRFSHLLNHEGKPLRCQEQAGHAGQHHDLRNPGMPVTEVRWLNHCYRVPWEQQRKMIDLMADRGYPFAAAAAHVLRVYIGPGRREDPMLYKIGEEALAEAARRGYVKPAEKP